MLINEKILNSMDITSYLKFLSPIQDQLSGFYSTATLLITLLFILWVFNFFFSLIFKIFAFGKTIGSIYRNYIHKYIRFLIFSMAYLVPKKKSLQ